ncbi:unnamed protein product [Chrysoparadoxa australica]
MLHLGRTLRVGRQLLRAQYTISAALRSSYPPHEVVGMPALSPTMEAGNMAKYNLKEGAAISAGDVICEIETDKATVDFEAQDDAFLAKILVPEGAHGIPVGQPIFITVEEEESVAAFGDYVADELEVQEAAAPAPAPTPAPEPLPEAVPEPVVLAAEPVNAAAAAAAEATPLPAPVAAAPAAPPSQTAGVPYFAKRWGTNVEGSSAYGWMEAAQEAYTAKYGSTLQAPTKR